MKAEEIYEKLNEIREMISSYEEEDGTMHTAVSSGSWCGGQRQQCGDSGSGLR